MTKSERFTVHLTRDQEALIRRAAEVEGADLADFIVSATVVHAHDVLADRRRYVLDEAAWTQFNALLDRPVRHKPALAKLFACGVD